MKNFKLRAWDKKTKQMLNVSLIDLGDSIIYNAKNENFIGSYIKKGFYSPDGFLDIDRLIFMQYTRLNDVEGIEIYEGDILEANFVFEEVDGSSYLENVMAKVYFNEAKGAWEIEEVNGETDPLGDWISNGNAKVVGNIFEATEVVEEKATCSRKEQV